MRQDQALPMRLADRAMVVDKIEVECPRTPPNSASPAGLTLDCMEAAHQGFGRKMRLKTCGGVHKGGLVNPAERRRDGERRNRGNAAAATIEFGDGARDRLARATPRSMEIAAECHNDHVLA